MAAVLTSCQQKTYTPSYNAFGTPNSVIYTPLQFTRHFASSLHQEIICLREVKLWSDSYISRVKDTLTADA